jgi:hypothetical protein
MSKGPLPVLWTDRFNAKWKRDANGCHLWVAQTNSRGYGVFYRDPARTHQLAHRAAYEMAFGPIPDGVLIDHICHVRSCVNPAHLRLATASENNQNRSPSIAPKAATGFLGVRLHSPNGLYTGRVQHLGKVHCTGYFATPEQANEAVVALRNRLFTHNDHDRRADYEEGRNDDND